jgi:hypothetical protein
MVLGLVEAPVRVCLDRNDVRCGDAPVEEMMAPEESLEANTNGARPAEATLDQRIIEVRKQMAPKLT